MHADTDSRRHRGELYAALAAMGFGSSYVATSVALHGFAPLPAAVWRSVLAALALGVIITMRGRSGGAVPAATSGSIARGARLLVLALLAGPVFLAAMNMAVAHVGATITAFVAGLYAVLSAVIAPALLPERLTVRVLAGFVLALAGTALLAELDPGRSDAIGLLWGLVAALSFATFLVLTRRWSGPYRMDGLTVAFTTTVVSSLTLGGIVLVIGSAPLVPASLPLDAVAATVWLAAAAAFGQMLMVASVRLIPAARSAAFLLLNPITATILAALLLGERPTPLQLAGGALVLLGMAAVTLPLGGARSRQQETAA